MNFQRTPTTGRKDPNRKQFTRMEKTTKPPSSSKETQARAVLSHYTSNIDAFSPQEEHSIFQGPPSASSRLTNPQTASNGPAMSLQSIGPKRRRGVEDDYPTKRERKDSQPTVDSIQPFQVLSKKNLEELDRLTGLGPSNGMDRATTSSGRGEKKGPLSLQSSTADMDEESASITSQNSSTTATYRWRNLTYARIFVEDGPLPENIRSRVNTIILPKSTEVRKNELSLITESFSNAFIHVMTGALSQDDSVAPVHHALTSMDKGKKFMLPRKTDWDSSLKPDVQHKTFHFDTLGQPNSTADDSLDHPNKRQQAEPAHIPPNSPEPTMPPPLLPLNQDIFVLRTPRPDITLGPKLNNLVEVLKARGLREFEAWDFLEALQYRQALRFSPLQPTVPICFPPMVVEGKSYSTGKLVFEAQNQAAVSGAYMTNMQHNLAKFTESTCHGSHQSKEPLAFSICTEGPMVQLWVHYTKMKGDVRQYHMNIIKICHASSLPSLRDGVLDFFEAVDGVMRWATSELLDEIADQLVLVWKGTQQAT